MTNCMSFCLYCYTFVFSHLFSSSVLSSDSLSCLWLLSRTSIFQHPNTPFSCRLALFFSLPVTTSIADTSCAVSCTVATNQALHSSGVICVTQKWKCALFPHSSVSTDSHLSTLSLASRSDWKWAKSLRAQWKVATSEDL